MNFQLEIKASDIFIARNKIDNKDMYDIKIKYLECL